MMTMTGNKIVRLAAEGIEAGGRALAVAFHDDPLQTYVLPDAEERVRLSPAHFTAIVRYGNLFGEVYTTAGTPEGVAVWLPPGASEVTPDRAVEAGLDQLPTLVGAEPMARFDQVLGFLEPFHRKDVPAEHWYVMVVGVVPARQGQGVGSALLRPIIERANADGLPCYLETAQPRNVPFYRKIGFEVIVETVEPVSRMRLWTFRRDPR
jgi:GNAT superfamily N-acetyltransferase